jgi:heme A synthase
MKLTNLAKYAWGVLAYNLVVILWGAYVRATGSGAGCGSHWPLCNGEVIPRAQQLETMIEFTHRLTSGMALLLVAGLLIWALRAYPKGHHVRTGAWLSAFFIITEALVGAGLVLFEWVADDASTGRVISMAVHLINTFLLLASLSLCAWWASGGARLQLDWSAPLLWLFIIGFLGVVVIGVTGAVTALGDTLFPVESLREGLAQDLSPSAHFLVRLRIWHPVIAILVGFYLMFVGGLVYMFREQKNTRRFALGLIGLFLVQLLAGGINLLLLAPVWMQLIHLLLADLVWITLVLLAANEFAQVGETIPKSGVLEAQPAPHTG